MDIQQATFFLASTILFSVGIGSLALILLAINNVYSKYWKPIKVISYHGASETEAKVTTKTFNTLKK